MMNHDIVGLYLEREQERTGRNRHPPSETDSEVACIRVWPQSFTYECERLLNGSGIQGVRWRNLAFQRSKCRHGTIWCQS
jgi:hypothetical protein